MTKGPAPLWALGQEGWSWHHFDIATPGLADWLEDISDAHVANALTSRETRPSVTPHADGLLVNLRGVNLNPNADPEDMVSLRMWVTQSAMISARKRKVMTALSLKDSLEGGLDVPSTEALLQRIARGLVERIEAVVLEIEDKVDALEDAHMEGERLDQKSLLLERRALIQLRRFLYPQRVALEDLASHFEATDLGPAHRDTALRMSRTLEALDATRERLVVLSDHLLAEEAARQGRNSYVLSVIAAVFLPLGFLTGLFGVNVGGIPGVDNPAGFAIITLASIASGAGLYFLFKHWKWL